MRNSIRTIVVLLGIAQGLAGCRGKESSPSPVSPSPGPPAPVTGLQPRITEVAPTTSTTTGGAWGTISGTAFEPGARVAFGAAAPLQVFVPDSSTVQFWTNAHEAGTVDVVVRNPSGREDTLARGYTFAPPESFDFNGTWVAHAGDEYETDMRFVVENNRLKSVTCGASPTVMFSAEPAHDPSPCEGIEIAERCFGRTVAEVVGPSSQERVHALEEGGDMVQGGCITRFTTMVCGLPGAGFPLASMPTSVIWPT